LPGEVRQEGHDGNLVVPAVQDVPHLDKHSAAPNPPVRGSTVDRGTQNTRQLQGSPRSLKVAVEVARFRNTGVVSGSCDGRLGQQEDGAQRLQTGLTNCHRQSKFEAALQKLRSLTPNI
jgi:hypothetical protein